MTDKKKLDDVWKQKRIPVIKRLGKEYPLLIRLPYQDNNRAWLQNGRRSKPKWDKNQTHWEIPKVWFNDIVDRSLERWGMIWIIQPHRTQEKCAPACWNAEGHECQCSCMGEHHGSQSSSRSWFIVSETFATRWGTEEIACRLLKRPSS
ncbi:MAG: hypothetical protein KA155_01990 [Alphaproteobacteria bacterium]|jgi:hypothetical protein|nr:hypothetical protein [Alphaproteobacteria bacterium]